MASNKVYEGIDFYVQIYLDRNHLFNIKAKMLGGSKELDHDQSCYLPETLPEHSVRVPALMVASIDDSQGMKSQVLNDDLNDIFNNLIRRQAGTHLFVSSENGGVLFCIVLQWESKESMEESARTKRSLIPGDDWSLDPLNCAYPCYVTDRYVNKNQPITANLQFKFDLLLGNAFFRKKTTNDYMRSYCRYERRLFNNCCQDIDPEFIAKEFTQAMHYQNTKFFGHIDDMNHTRIAFYVCCGGKLVVVDSRINRGNYSGKAQRCFYQQGSLVVLYAAGSPHQFGICFDDETKNRDWPYVADNMLEFSGERPAQRDFDEFEMRHDGTQRRDGSNRINRMKDKVIFLGAVDSQFQSLCWKIRINESKGAFQDFKFYIDMPEGGVIQDVAPWEAGFALIRARCHYEQSWSNIVDAPVAQAKWKIPEPFRFLKPSEDYIIRRIVGIEYKPMIVRYPENLNLPKVTLKENETDFRHFIRYNEILTEWHEFPGNVDIPPPPPPLYPPAKHRGQLWYPDIGAKVFWKIVNNYWVLSVENFEETNGTAKIYDPQFEEEAAGWPWVKWTQEKEDEVRQFIDFGNHIFDRDPHVWYRESVDRVKYLKYIPDDDFAESKFNIGMWYLHRLF